MLIFAIFYIIFYKLQVAHFLRRGWSSKTIYFPAERESVNERVNLAKRLDQPDLAETKPGKNGISQWEEIAMATRASPVEEVPALVEAILS